MIHLLSKIPEGRTSLPVVMLEDGRDDDELRPLEGVRGGVEHEEEQDQPPTTVAREGVDVITELN